MGSHEVRRSAIDLERSHLLRRSVLYLSLVFALPATAAGQSNDLSTITPCRSCELRPTPIVALGTDTEDGLVETRLAEVRVAPGADAFLLFSQTRTSLRLFDADGVPLVAFGRRGRGPGELQRLVDAQFLSDGTILVADANGWRRFSQEGDLLSEHRGPSMFPFRPLDSERVVQAGWDMRPQSAGYPLHFLSVESGEVRHFGSVSGDWSAREVGGHVPLLGLSGPGGPVWWTLTRPGRIEKWKPGGSTPEEVIHGALPWLRPKGGSEVPPRIGAFGLDHAGRLWVLSAVPDEDQESVQRFGSEGLVLARDEDDFWDARVDVIDVAGGRHIGTYTSDSIAVDLVWREGEILMSEAVIGRDGVLRLVLSRLLPRGEG